MGRRILIVISVFCFCISGYALSGSSEAFSFYDFMTGYSDSEALALQNDRLCLFDYSSGSCLPLCTHPECIHTVSDDQFGRFSTTLEMMNNPSVCYASRMGKASGMGIKHLLYEGKIYSYDDYIIDPRSGDGESGVYESIIDGETRVLALLGDLFSPEQSITCDSFMICNGYIYLSLRSDMLITDSNEEDECDYSLQSETLVKISISDGKASVMKTVCSQECTVYFLGIWDNILYYQLNSTGDVIISEQLANYQGNDNLTEKKSSILGINVLTNETVKPDVRLSERSVPCNFSFDIVRDGVLYSIIWPETPETDPSLFLIYDLSQQKILREYSFQYLCDTDYYPYFVLNDETLLSMNIENGTYARYNLKTGDIHILPFPALNLNAEQDELYDVNPMLIQPTPIVFDHYYNGYCNKAYITADELLTDNPVIHDFIDEK